MPGHQVFRLDVVVLGQGGIDLSLGVVVGFTGQGIELIEERQYLGLILLVEMQHHFVKVAKTELLGCLVT